MFKVLAFFIFITSFAFATEQIPSTVQIKIDSIDSKAMDDFNETNEIQISVHYLYDYGALTHVSYNPKTVKTSKSVLLTHIEEDIAADSKAKIDVGTELKREDFEKFIPLERILLNRRMTPNYIYISARENDPFGHNPIDTLTVDIRDLIQGDARSLNIYKTQLDQNKVIYFFKLEDDVKYGSRLGSNTTIYGRLIVVYDDLVDASKIASVSDGEMNKEGQPIPVIDTRNTPGSKTE